MTQERIAELLPTLHNTPRPCKVAGVCANEHAGPPVCAGGLQTLAAGAAGHYAETEGMLS